MHIQRPVIPSFFALRQLLSFSNSSTSTTKWHPRTPIHAANIFTNPSKLTPPEMRLITLLPGPFSSQVQATLSAASFDDPIPYEAISYAWGDPSITAPILLDGIEFPITVNLESALRHFRFEEKSRLLWADAICINQLDIRERNIQVKFVGEIYKRCSRCLTWLGEVDEDGKRCIRFHRGVNWWRVPSAWWFFGDAKYNGSYLPDSELVGSNIRILEQIYASVLVGSHVGCSRSRATS
jgi:hypothetical protein